MKLTSSVDGGAGNAYKAQAGYGFDTPWKSARPMSSLL